MKRGLPSFALVGALMLLTLPGQAESADGAVAPASSSVREEAKAHFDRALKLYRTGKYRGALPELEHAVALDPQGKDLVYNLALVREKLDDYDGAIEAFCRLAAMERDPLERERIAQSIVRLEGAREERAALSIPVERAPAPVRLALPVPPGACAARGRFDSWVLGAGIVSAAAAVLGTVYGVRAMTLDPSGESTGPGRSFADLRADAARARRAALIADVSFGVSIAAGLTGATLYLGRSAVPASPGSRASGAWLFWVF